MNFLTTFKHNRALSKVKDDLELSGGVKRITMLPITDRLKVYTKIFEKHGDLLMNYRIQMAYGKRLADGKTHQNPRELPDEAIAQFTKMFEVFDKPEMRTEIARNLLVNVGKKLDGFKKELDDIRIDGWGKKEPPFNSLCDERSAYVISLSKSNYSDLARQYGLQKEFVKIGKTVLALSGRHTELMENWHHKPDLETVGFVYKGFPATEAKNLLEKKIRACIDRGEYNHGYTLAQGYAKLGGEEGLRLFAELAKPIVKKQLEDRSYHSALHLANLAGLDEHAKIAAAAA